MTEIIVYAIPNNRYIKYTFTATDDTAVDFNWWSNFKQGPILSGGLILSDSGVANGYYISYLIPSTNSNNGVLKLEFTLTDGLENDGNQITETSLLH